MKMGNHFVFASCLSIISILHCLAGNNLSLPSFELPGGTVGSKVFIHSSHDIVVTGFSISVRYDPAAIAVVEVTTEGTGLSPEYWNGKHDALKGEFAYGAILNMSDPLAAALQPGGHDLARLTFDIVAKGPAATAIEFVDGLDVLQFSSNVLTDDKGASVRSPALELIPGAITIVGDQEPPPVADAGDGFTAVEKSTIQLDGSRSYSPSNRSLSFVWSYPPEVSPLEGLDTPKPRFVLADVSGDLPLIFKLMVDDGLSASMDQVAVHAIDLDLRKGIASALPAGAAIIEDGRKAVLFSGEIRWEPGPEDGKWTGIDFHGGGAGDESALLGAARLYADENGNQVFDPADRQLGAASVIPADNGEISFQFSEILAPSTARRFFLVVDLQQKTALAALLYPLILTGLGSGLLLWTRRRAGVRGDKRCRESTAWALSRLSIAGILLMTLCPLACSGGGGNKSGTVPTKAAREVRFDLVSPDDVQLLGASSGIRIPLTGLPISGPPLEV